jgi:arylsulfatase A-like enzyme
VDKAAFFAEVRGVDVCVGALMEHLKELEIYNDSLIIVTSDHGEEFWEHDGFEHGHTLYNELLWVPLIVKLPNNSVKGSVERAVSINSILPTVLDLCGIDYPEELYPDGSLVNFWGQNFSGSSGPPIVSTGLGFYEDKESIIFEEGGYKYIRSLVSGREKFYDLVEDPQELVSFAQQADERVEQAKELLGEHHELAGVLKKLFKIGPAKTAELDRDMIQQLKSLGYIE